MGEHLWAGKPPRYVINHPPRFAVYAAAPKGTGRKVSGPVTYLEWAKVAGAGGLGTKSTCGVQGKAPLGSPREADAY